MPKSTVHTGDSNEALELELEELADDDEGVLGAPTVGVPRVGEGSRKEAEDKPAEDKPAEHGPEFGSVVKPGDRVELKPAPASTK